MLFNDIPDFSKVEAGELDTEETDSLLSSNPAESCTASVLEFLSDKNATVCTSRKGIVS